MKKFLSVFLSFALLFTSFSVSAFADNPNKLKSLDDGSQINALLESNISSKEEVDRVTNDIKLLDNCNIDNELLIGINKDTNNNFKYIYALSDKINSEISIKKLSDGYEFNIVEGKLSNIVLIKNSGRIFLNGKEVKATISMTARAISSSTEPSIVTRGVVENYWTATCPYGKRKDYTDYQGKETNANVAFGDNVRNLTIGAFTLILSAFLPMAAGLGVGAFSLLLTSIQDSNPASTAASFKDYSYYHKTNGYWAKQGLGVTMHKAIIYPLADYKGNSTTIYNYYCHKLL